MGSALDAWTNDLMGSRNDKQTPSSCNQGPSPTKFLQHLAGQVQLLACLKWLGEFQITAIIPLEGSISALDVAALCGVPDRDLYRVVRMAATAGFLHEPQPGRIAHTALSSAFVTRFSLQDASMFLAENAAPTALHMATAQPHHDHPGSESAYAVASNTSTPFHSAIADEERLQRQYSAYRKCSEDAEDSVPQVLLRLNWRSMGSACVVDACAQSTDLADALAENFPSLRFIVQTPTEGDCLNGPAACSERITMQRKTPNGQQLVKDALVYIIRIPTLGPAPYPQLRSELKAHLPILRGNPSATLIVAPPLLPEPGSVDPSVESLARLRDLSNLQFTSECKMELSELITVINSVRDDSGRLVAANMLRFRSGATSAVSVKYEYEYDMNNFYNMA
ncbi:hypothetical protein LTR97_012255 [Elasticomyces elasticus]|uniref:Uncharacterized protein n=1 Tax=Elasticomyces elasticus TaxID=574655 RepID=A0AAN7VWZ8_9PEZI|nr:hypothetical protein LTR97_012255 [Elasticomyces elasticus]